jgi:hypothetical protein
MHITAKVIRIKCKGSDHFYRIECLRTQGRKRKTLGKELLSNLLSKPCHGTISHSVIIQIKGSKCIYFNNKSINCLKRDGVA